MLDGRGALFRFSSHFPPHTRLYTTGKIVLDDSSLGRACRLVFLFTFYTIYFYK